VFGPQSFTPPSTHSSISVRKENIYAARKQFIATCGGAPLSLEKSGAVGPFVSLMILRTTAYKRAPTAIYCAYYFTESSVPC